MGQALAYVYFEDEKNRTVARGSMAAVGPLNNIRDFIARQLPSKTTHGYRATYSRITRSIPFTTRARFLTSTLSGVSLAWW